MLPRWFKWVGPLLLAGVAGPVLLILLFGWNWLRAPVERLALERTGRVLSIAGDLRVRLAWPHPRLFADGVTFANPAWAREKDMVAAASVEVTLDLRQLLAGHLAFPEVRLTRPVIYLETAADGRRNWLLDRGQTDENAFARIGRLSLDDGRLGYDDVAGRTAIRARVSTAAEAAGGGAAGLRFSADGMFRGQALKAHGSGGPALAILADTGPYPLTIDATLGPTTLRAHGSITGLADPAVIDMQVGVRGGSLDELFPLLGIALPATLPYTADGHLARSGTTWRYERFAGRIGGSDIAGSLSVDTKGKRPALNAEIVSARLDIKDLGAVIGARPGSLRRARAAGAGPAATMPPPVAQGAAKTAASAVAHVLPDLPFDSSRWDSVDADVRLTARSIIGAGNWPLENVVTHLTLRDSVLKLEPLDFGMAGGHLDATITLDGRASPIRAAARVRVRDMRIGKLFPEVALNRDSIGRLNGEASLTGTGNSVGRMLATSGGTVRLAIARGEISRLMMERAGLHLWEILEISMTRDKLIHLRCALADFDVKAGVMHANMLIFDTEVTTISGSGSIDLGSERLDLVLRQKTKNTSPVALRSPIHVGGTLAVPEVAVDRGQVAARAIGAVALALINPLLALIPLIDPGPGRDSDCGHLAPAGVPAKRAAPR